FNDWTASRNDVTGRRHETTWRNGVMACDGATRRFLVTLFCDIFLTSSLLSAQAGSLLAVLPGSARAAGMGGAGAAIVGDAGAIFANPAALATIHHLAVEGSYESFPSGSKIGRAHV